MKIKQKNPDTAICAIDYAFRRLGGKYKGRILLHLHWTGRLRYGELRRTIPEITTKMLTQTLRELEEDELIERTAYKELPPRVEYALTPMGAQLVPFIILLRDWGTGQMIKEKIPVLGLDDCILPENNP